MTSDSLTYGQYWTEIESICASTLEESREYQREPTEVLHETLDGHEWVIYTHRNHQVLGLTNNQDAAAQLGTEGIFQDGMVNWALLTYCAMEADCFEHAEFDWGEIPEADDPDEASEAADAADAFDAADAADEADALKWGDKE